MDEPDEATLALMLRLQQEELDALVAAELAGRGNYKSEIAALKLSLLELNNLRDHYLSHRIALESALNDSTGSGQDDDRHHQAESTAGEQLTIAERPRNRLCSVCFRSVPLSKAVLLPCGEPYCNPCIIELFQLSYRDESLFPPRCCKQVIPLELVENVLTPDDIIKYNDKSLELNTLNRTYCSNACCSVFIPPKSISGDKAKCTHCGTITCALCKAKAHKGDCPADTALNEVLKLAKDENWQRCPKCRTMVELKYGCNHITCVCSHEFCYVCATQWRHCTCPQWQEDRLLDGATRIADRDRRVGLDRELGILAAAAVLRERHECDHTDWRSLDGAHECEICNDDLPLFIWECRQCRILMCRRCKRNRVR